MRSFKATYQVCLLLELIFVSKMLLRLPILHAVGWILGIEPRAVQLWGVCKLLCTIAVSCPWRGLSCRPEVVHGFSLAPVEWRTWLARAHTFTLNSNSLTHTHIQSQAHTHIHAHTYTYAHTHSLSRLIYIERERECEQEWEQERKWEREQERVREWASER